MKYGIDCGHNCPPRDTGAVGIGRECAMTRDVGLRVMAKLRELGHEVVDCTPKTAASVSSSLAQRCQIANSNKVDVFVSIHFNAFNGQAHGTEVYHISPAGERIAKRIVDEIAKLGFFNRGAKRGAFFVLKRTNMPAVLVEGCFVDSKRDMDLYDAEKMADAIVVGLTGDTPQGQN